MKPDTQPDRMIGQTIAGRYEVVRKIGKGGMGAVYEVRHLKVNKTFALKTMAEELLGSVEALARFRREAEVIARLNHPNIVEVVDWEQLDNGVPCMVMEFLRGESLASVIKRQGKLPWETIALIGDQIGSALSVAHNAGIVHRDLKPENILLAIDDAGEVSPKLLDFGVSKVHNSITIATADERLLGTPGYMSPEQADGDQARVGPATDVWAMGAILFEMAAGEAAFQAASVPSLLYQVCHGKPLPLEPRRPDAPPAFCRLVSRAMSRDHSRRITNADALRVGLRASLESMSNVTFAESLDIDISDAPDLSILTETTLSSSVGALHAAGSRGRSAVAWVGALALLALGAAGGLWYYQTQQNQENGTPAAASNEAPVAASNMASARPAAVTEDEPVVQIVITSEPEGALVYRTSDNVHVGETPYRREYEQKDGAEEFRLQLPDYESAIVTVETNSDVSRHVQLVRVQEQDVAEAKEPHPAKPTRKRSSHKRSSHKRSSHKRSSHKRSSHKRSSHKRSSHKRSEKHEKPQTKPDSKLGDRTVNPFGASK